MTSRRGNDPTRLAAFEAVVAHYEAALLRYAARLCGSEDSAQDIVQETFIRLLRHWREPFEPSAKLANWLYRVAHNCAVDWLRKQARRRLLHFRFQAETPDVQAPNPTDGSEISPAATRAAAALRTLSARERQLVVLKVYEEKSYKDIAAITGLRTGNVGYILHHAMRKLARALAEANTEDPAP